MSDFKLAPINALHNKALASDKMVMLLTEGAANPADASEVKAALGLTVISASDYGTIGDGESHTVAEWLAGGDYNRGYANLAAIQADYPLVESLDDEIDHAAIQEALRQVSLTGVGGTVVIPTGYYMLNRHLTIYGRSVTLQGAGRVSTWLEMTDPDADGIRLGYKNDVVASGNQAYGCRLESFTLHACRTGTSTGVGVNTSKPDGTEGFWIYEFSAQAVNVHEFATGWLAANLPQFLLVDCLFTSHGICVDLAKCDTFQILCCAGGGAYDDITGVPTAPNTTGVVFRVRSNDSGSPSGGNFGGLISVGEYGNCARLIDIETGRCRFEHCNTETFHDDTTIDATGGVMEVYSNRFANSLAVTGDAVIRMTDAAIVSMRGNTLDTDADPIVVQTDFNYYSKIPNADVGVVWRNAAGVETQRSTASSFEPRNETWWTAISNPTLWRGYVYYKPAIGGLASDMLASVDDGSGTGVASSIVNRQVGEIISFASNLSSAAGGGETTLNTATAPAGRLAVNGSVLTYHASGRFAANGNNKRIRVGGNMGLFLDTGVVTHNDKGWSIKGTVTRIDGSAVMLDFSLSIEGQTPVTYAQYHNQTLSFAFPLAILTTGTAAADVLVRTVKMGYSIAD